MSKTVKFKQIEEKIITIRSLPVILISDVAELYEVETREISQAVKNNPAKFPKDYIIEITNDEKQEVIKNFDNPKVKFSPSLPKAFSEKGLYMLATILKGEKATQTTIEIIEVFAKIRELSHTIAQLSESPDEPTRKSLMQRSGEIIADIIYDDMHVIDTETSIEINLALMKFKHTVKRKK